MSILDWRKRSIMAIGGAEPPTPTSFRLSSSRLASGLESTYWNSISQTVGTPMEEVTFSSFISLYRLSPSICGPGKTSLAPAMGAE